MARIALGEVETGVQSLRRAVEISRELDDMDALADGYGNLADMLSLAGRSGDGLATAHEGLAAIPARHARSHNWLVLTVSELAFETGDWELARTHLGAPDDAYEDPFGLTPRERQILALVAQGAMNRQIGAALFMAEKTASVHVSRILGKLGVQTRTQAAAVAHRQQLA